MDLSVVECGGSQLHGAHVAAIHGFTRTSSPRGPFRYHVSAYDYKPVEKFFRGCRAGVCHWIGTDALYAFKKNDRRFGDLPNVVHWADAPNLADELATLGIEAEVVTHEPRNFFREPVPLEGDAVMVYTAEGQRTLFKYKVVAEAARQAGRELVELPRERLRANTPPSQVIDDVFRECSHYVRLIDHDGWSHMASEMILAGRCVLTNQDRPYQIKVEPTVEDVLAHLDDEPDPAGPAHYREILDRKQVIRRWTEILEKHGG